MIVAMALLALSPGECRTLIDLGREGEIDRWQVVNDGVMGGLSRGQIAQDEEAMRFWGEINTDGGGFSSIRRQLLRGALSDADRLRVTMKSDGRDYQLSMRTGERRFGRSVAYRATLNPEGQGDWKVASVDLTNLEPSIFGRRVRAPIFDPADARSIGFILADGQDGPFEMHIHKIEACRG